MPSVRVWLPWAAAWLALLVAPAVAAAQVGSDAAEEPAPRGRRAPPQPAPADDAAQPPARTQPPADSRPPRARQAAAGQPARGRPAGGARTQRRAGPPRLTAEDEAALDQVLSAWEERSAEIQRFNCTFTRLDYNYAFPKKDGNGKILKDAQGNIVPDESAGDIKYAAPDKGLYAVDGEFLKERWICDGKSVFEYDFQQKQLIEHPLPPELQGQAIVDGPLPFFFGAEATKLKRRYFLRIVTPPANEEQQIWIEARPRTPADAANFTVATLILNKVDFLPFGLEVVDSSGKKRTVHQFNDCVVNDPWHGLKRDPFKPLMFRGWTKIVEEPPTAGPAADPGAPGRQDQPPPRNAGRPRTPPRE